MLDAAHLEALFDCLPDLVFFVKNRRAEYVVVSQTLVERLRKRSKQELIGRRADEVFPAPLGRSYRAQDEQVLEAGAPIRDQLELHFYPAGRRGWCVTQKLPLRGRDGTITGLYGFSKDLQAANERSADFSQVAEAVQRIQTRYDERLRVSELARRAGLSQYQFEQRVRRIFRSRPGSSSRKCVSTPRCTAARERRLGGEDRARPAAIPTRARSRAPSARRSATRPRSTALQHLVEQVERVVLGAVHRGRASSTAPRSASGTVREVRLEDRLELLRERARRGCRA